MGFTTCSIGSPANSWQARSSPNRPGRKDSTTGGSRCCSPANWFAGGGIAGIPGIEPTGSIKALRADTGAIAWEFKLKSPPWAGLLSTGGGLVFGGSSEGFFYALDAASGKPLWRFPTGGPIFANPISFLSDGKQHIAIAAGHALFVFAL